MIQIRRKGEGQKEEQQHTREEAGVLIGGDSGRVVAGLELVLI